MSAQLDITGEFSVVKNSKTYKEDEYPLRHA